MFMLAITSMARDSAIVDEVAHIPAGYSYLRYGDYRLNPEHPPLIKDLAGLPLQFMKLKFPDQLPAWKTDVNGQWEVGWNFLYYLGNDAQMVIFWSRLPILLLAIGFGAFLYQFVWHRWGKWVGLVTLFGYVFSPNFLAHSHYVTTDLGASVFIFMALAAFLRYVERSSRGNLVLLSLGLAAAQLAKFSSVLLYPFLAAMGSMIALVWTSKHSVWQRLYTYVGGLILASAGSLVWIYLYYVPHVIHMPVEVQRRLIDASLNYGQSSRFHDPVLALSNVPVLRPLAQYFLGLGMVFGRLDGGNVTYFLGQVSVNSFKAYFPVLFVLKTQIPLLLLMATLLASSIYGIFFRPKNWLKRFRKSFQGNFAEWLLGLFIGFYFAVAIKGNLDLGIRHILPIYVPLFVLVAIGTVRLARRYRSLGRSHLAPIALVVLALWYAGSAFWVAPHFISYFNELIGGPANADRYFSDSSVDWGQDLLRLQYYFISHPELGRVGVDYFGGAIPSYYFCKRLHNVDGSIVADASGYDCRGSVYEEWHSQYGKYPGKWLVVSETFLENDRYFAKFYNRSGYEYLRQRQPVAKIGYSLYLYQLY